MILSIQPLRKSVIISQLKAQMTEMQMEIDLLKETLNVLKKDRGVNLRSLKNREKTAMIDLVRTRYPLSALLEKVGLSRSNYYYQRFIYKRINEHEPRKERIKQLFIENYSCYGYRRIHALLKRDHIVLSEKTVRCIMKQEDLRTNIKKCRKYSSYQGEISLAVENIFARNFHSERPVEKLITDITEVAIGAGKVYLSPIINCFDGYLVSWSIGTSPNASLVNSMLDKAIIKLSPKDHPVIHTDRGCHYRWPEWIRKTEENGLVRSMSKKGCSPDNSACEGLFG